MEKKTKRVDDDIDGMYRAIAKYIEAHGGSAAVIGGISIAECPPLKYNYQFIVDFTGRPPKKAKL